MRQADSHQIPIMSTWLWIRLKAEATRNSLFQASMSRNSYLVQRYCIDESLLLTHPQVLFAPASGLSVNQVVALRTHYKLSSRIHILQNAVRRRTLELARLESGSDHPFKKIEARLVLEQVCQLYAELERLELQRNLLMEEELAEVELVDSAGLTWNRLHLLFGIVLLGTLCLLSLRLFFACVSASF